MILERKLTFPPELSEEARDLIDRILKVDPSQRLGAGAPGSDNDYRALKGHPFFRFIDFATVNSMTVPLDKKLPEEVAKLPTLTAAPEASKARNGNSVVY